MARDKIGGVEDSYETLVADICDKFVLGLNFLMAHGCTVDAGAGSLRIGVEEVSLHKSSVRKLARCYRLTAVEDTLISPYSETLVAARIMDDPLGKPWGTASPWCYGWWDAGWCLIRLCYCESGKFLCSTKNNLASCEPVESVIHQQHDFTPDS